MKRVLGIVVAFGLIGALTVVAQEVKPGKVDVVDFGEGVKLEMVLIPAGKFMMGSKKNPVDPFSKIKVEQPLANELPQHEVTFAKPFYMGKYEVTQEQWFRIMGTNPSYNKGAKLPITDISWDDCKIFIKILNAKTSDRYRLPTEAEWEYSCRAGTTTRYSFGDNLTKSDANSYDSAIKAPVVVGSYKPNAFGLYDMHGNVWEWCNDWYGPLQGGEVTNPKGPDNGTYRVLRGGSFYNYVSDARSSYRSVHYTPSTHYYSYGFRLARTADIKDAIAPPAIKTDPSVIIPATGNLLVAPFTESKAKEVQIQVAKILQKEVEEKADLGKGLKLDLVLIPAGKFMMGSPADEKGRNGDEKQHEVTLTKPFYMGKYEITREQYESVMGNNPTDTKGAKLPVTDVSWNDCQEFIKKLNTSTKGKYRLPTEAEWEYACRAGTITTNSFGDNTTPNDANYRDSEIGKSVAVGSYKPNAFGLYDMHGNVREWCEDWYRDYPEGATTDPKGPGAGTHRVLRGGSFYSGKSEVRSSFRYLTVPSNRLSSYGFRLARTP